MCLYNDAGSANALSRRPYARGGPIQPRQRSEQRQAIPELRHGIADGFFANITARLVKQPQRLDDRKLYRWRHLIPAAANQAGERVQEG
ncbi:hypothetical protein [Bradyrhizobium sp. 2S1]|uniref:hypothetical protein n=1 Tax=Bradyrhizobium sp. 2S1 TaxID=1404429 RepID=UPI00140CF5A8|nr:hypothetical protein [Bradyrhizobium sp. 2S1]MCK7664536.1 hypothetical protein [Bradyrhizobium sp. 2S1]